jgi:ferritin-like metal-binding protein YciE
MGSTALREEALKHAAQGVFTPATYGVNYVWLEGPARRRLATGSDRNNKHNGLDIMSKLNDCFLAELADIYDAEKQLIKALPKMARAAEHEELSEAFTSHHAQTEEHVRRLDEVFELMGDKVPTQKCKAMQGLIAEIDERIDEELGDASLICGAQKVEHYEIAAYGCLRTWAKLLDHDEAANLLEETLDEESDADEHLTSLAVRIVNLDAREPEHATKDGGSDDE